MGYAVSLTDPVTHETILLDYPHQMHGGTYAMDGTPELWLSITYNYAPIYKRVLPGQSIRSLYGMTGAESIPALESAIAQLGDDVDDDYWKATEGNAKRALCQLLAMAKMRPDGVWDGD